LTGFLKGNVEAAGSFGAESVVVPPRTAAEVWPGPEQREAPVVAIRGVPSAQPQPRSRAMIAKPKSRAGRPADWWEADEAMPAAPPAPSVARKRRKARSSGAPPAVWLVGGALLGIIVVGAVVLAFFRG